MKITRQLQIDLATYNAGVDRSRRDYYRLCRHCAERPQDGNRYLCAPCRKKGKN